MLASISSAIERFVNWHHPRRRLGPLVRDVESAELAVGYFVLVGQLALVYPAICLGKFFSVSGLFSAGLWGFVFPRVSQMPLQECHMDVALLR